MTPEEMFEKLGYELLISDGLSCDRLYRRKETKTNFIPDDKDKARDITFRYESVRCEYYETNSITHHNTKNLAFYMTVDELDAINKQVEELGWRKSK